MKRLLLIFLMMVVARMQVPGQIPFGYAVNLVVPSDSTNKDGNTYSVLPVLSQPFTMRYQQVYAASEFAALGVYGGGWVFGVDFRGDATNGTQVGFTIGIRVGLSTTQHGPDQLSATFADNVGADDTTVFNGSLQAIIVGKRTGGDPDSFSSFQILFSKMFFYNPAAGNLLLDIEVGQGNSNTNIEARLDAWDRPNDSVSRVIGDLNAATGSLQTIGLATRWYFWPNPNLHVERGTNSVMLTWPSHPDFFVLQSVTNLGGGVQWQPITSGILVCSPLKVYEVPLDSSAESAYFRLVSGTTGGAP